MARLRLLCLPLVALCANVAVAQVPPDQTPAGERAAATPSAPAGNPIVAGPGSAAATTPLPSAKPRRQRAISADVAAQLSAAVPKYTPPPPKPPPAPEDDETDLREIDKPRNGIVRLPKFIVRERPPPVLSERAVNTRKGLEDIAMKRYLTETDRALNRFTLPLVGASGAQRAMSMYEEDERLKNMADLNEDARMVSASDKASGMYVKRQVDSTFMRPGSFDWRPIGR